MKFRLSTILVITLLFSCRSANYSDEFRKKTQGYIIHNIEVTKRYYVLKTIVESDSVLLVVDKKSAQLKGKILQVGENHTFNAYRFYDVFALNASMCHSVDGKKIWCHSDKIDLRFTDGMGNNIVED